MAERNVPKIREMYGRLEKRSGDPGWWPARTAFEVVVGAILTQNTAWTNVEKAIKRLRSERLLTPAGIMRVPAAELAGVIRPAGYHRVKARSLKAISGFLIEEAGGSLRRLKKQDAILLREKLLAVKGVGPETADSILLYALEKPVFVVDAYTKRIFSRHGLIREDASYRDVQEMVHRELGMDAEIFNRFHAYLVETAKRFCKKKAGQCEGCPLDGM
jgi:endonuclease III related protein